MLNYQCVDLAIEGIDFWYMDHIPYNMVVITETPQKRN